MSWAKVAMCTYLHLLCICGSVHHVLPLHLKTLPTHHRVAYGGDPGLGQITGNPRSLHRRIHGSLLYSETLTYEVASPCSELDGAHR